MEATSSVKVKKWIDEHLPVLSWNIIKIVCLKDFVINGISPNEIKETVIYQEELLLKIENEIKKRYLNDTFLKNDN